VCSCLGEAEAGGRTRGGLDHSKKHARLPLKWRPQDADEISLIHTMEGKEGYDDALKS